MARTNFRTTAAAVTLATGLAIAAATSAAAAPQTGTTPAVDRIISEEQLARHLNRAIALEEEGVVPLGCGTGGASPDGAVNDVTIL
jgi:hypothetical protein